MSKKYYSEKEFENNVVIPMLKLWGVKFEREKSVTNHIGHKRTYIRADIVISFNRKNCERDFVIETKKRIYDDFRLNDAREQAVSYCTRLNVVNYSVISQDGFWIYQRQLAKDDKLIRKFSYDDIIRERNGQCWNILQTLLFLYYGDKYNKHKLFRRHWRIKYPRIDVQPAFSQQSKIQTVKFKTNNSSNSIFENNPKVINFDDFISKLKNHFSSLSDFQTTLYFILVLFLILLIIISVL